MKHFACSAAILILLVTNCLSEKAKFAKGTAHHELGKSNAVSKIVMAVGPDVVMQYLMGNYTPGSLYKFNVTDFLTDMFQVLKPSKHSECIEDIFHVVKALAGLEYWAIQMFDAQGKVTSGLTDGNIIWPGSYVVCRDIVQGPPFPAHKKKPFRGKFCWADMEAETSWLELPPDVDDVKIPPVRWGLCIPDTCSAEQLRDIITNVTEFDLVRKLLNLTEVSCLPKQSDIWKDKNSILALLIFVAFVMLISLATAVDLLTSHRELTYSVWKKNLFPTNDQQTAATGDTLQQRTTLRLAKEACLAFSLRRNFYKLINIEDTKSYIGCINGIRIISMVWIIILQIAIVGAMISDNLMSIIPIMQSVYFELIINAVLAIDTFFLLSGLLLSYNYFSHREKNDGKTSWIKFYLYRYLRLTPVYLLFILLIDNCLINYIAVGPFWPYNGFEGDNCNHNWWWNMLYITNFMPSKETCLDHSWYLSTDMQFFILSPIILILLSRYFPIGIIVSGLFIILSWLSSGFISYHYKMEADINLIKLYPKTEPWYNAQDRFYFKPYVHIAPYVFGILLGWLLYRTKGQQRLKLWIACLGWTLSILSIPILTVGLYQANKRIDLITASLYHAFSRTLWSLALSWIIFACSNGYGGIINYFLSSPALKPLSQLTYCAYLSHYLIINVIFDRSNVPFHFGYVYITWHAIATIFFIYLSAIPLTLIFEMPFLQLLKINPK